jgi:methyl-accepting chemotaxis protein
MSKKTNISVANVAIKELVDRMNELQDSLDGTDSSAESFKSAMGEMAGIIKSFASALEEAKKKAEPMAGTVDKMRERQKELKSQVESTTEVMSDGYTKAAKRLKDVNFELAQQRKYLGNDTAKVYNTFTKILEGFKIDFSKEDLTYNEMKQLNDMIVQLQDSTSRTSGEFKNLTEAFKNLTVARQKYENDFKGKKNRDIGFDDEVKGIERLLQEAEDELRNMAYRGLTNTEDYQKKIKEAGVYRRAIDSVSFAIDRQAMEVSKLQDVFDAMRLGTSVFGVIEGSMAAFGVESERLEKTLVRLNGVMVITNSLQEINEMLTNKASVAYRIYAYAARNLSGVLSEVQNSTLAMKAVFASLPAIIGVLTYTAIANWKDLNKQVEEGNILLRGWYKTLLDLKNFMEKSSWLERWTDAMVFAGRQIMKTSGNISTMLDNLLEFTGAYEALDKLSKNDLFFDKVDDFEEAMKRYERMESYMEHMERVMRNRGKSDIEINEERYKSYSRLFWMFDRLGVQEDKKIEERRQEVMDDIRKSMSDIRYENLEIRTRPAKDGSSKLSPEYQREVEEIEHLGRVKEAQTRKESEGLRYIIDEYNKLIDKMRETNSVAQEQIDIIEKRKLNAERQLEIALIKEAHDLTEKNAKKAEDLTEAERKALKEKNDAIVSNAETALKNIDKELKKRQELAKIEEEELEINGYLTEEIAGKRRVSALNDELSVSFERFEVLSDTITLLELNGASEEQILKINEMLNLELDKQLVLRRRIGTENLRYERDEQRRAKDRRIGEINREYEPLLTDARERYDDADIKGAQPSKLYKLKADELSIEAEILQRQLDEGLIATEKVEEAKREIYEKTRQAYLYAEQSKIEKTKETFMAMSAFGNATAELFDTVGKAVMDEAERELEAGKITEKEAEKRFEKGKRVQLASTWISTLAGAIEAYMGGIATIPGPAGIALGSVLAATAFAAGVARHREIKATTLDNNGGGSAQTNALQMMAVQPLLDQTADTNALTTLSIQSGQYSEARVYILESDIQDSYKKVEVRESSVDFK